MPQLPVRNVWFNDTSFRFVDAGMTPMRNAHVYAFVHSFSTSGQPIRVLGQFNIADTVPGDPLLGGIKGPGCYMRFP